MENKQVKVYLGRRSICSADDVNCPNPATFYLPDTIEKLIIKYCPLENGSVTWEGVVRMSGM